MFLQTERYDWLQSLAEIIGIILNFFKPVVTPLGEFTVLWIDFLMNFFPSKNITIYVVIFIILICSAIFINTRWPGEQYVSIFGKDSESSDSESSDSKYDYDSSDENEEEPTLDGD